MLAEEIINYWYADEMKKQWFASTPALDREIAHKFESAWELAASGELDSWCQTAEGSLALTIILDQFPLNMFRGSAKAFSTEQKAVAVARNAIESGYDRELSKDKLGFLFMPLMHSENLEDQALAVKMFTRHDLKDNLRFSEHHMDIIKNFGRFPHRNEILGRKNTSAELEYLNSKQAFKG